MELEKPIARNAALRSDIKKITVHTLRVALLAAIFIFIRLQSQQFEATLPPPSLESAPLAKVRAIFPNAHSLGNERNDIGGKEVRDDTNKVVGYVVQTSPQADDIVGFSGPTNLLVGFNEDDAIVGVTVLSSKDTREHVAQVTSDSNFLQSFVGGTWESPLPSNRPVDGVSGATLTSLAMAESIMIRLQGDRPRVTSLRFPEPISLAQARRFFPNAESVVAPPAGSSLWQINGANEKPIGEILRTTPAAEQIVGYQGPTEALVGLNEDGKIIGLAIGKSYDNEEYVGYVKEESYFLELFNEKTMGELATLDLQAEQVEGVSGATMTSLAIADGLVKAAAQQSKWQPPPTVEPKPKGYVFQWRDGIAAVVVLLALVVGFTSLRSNKYVRIGYPILLIVVLGFLSGDMVSQAMIAGWAENAIPWRTASGLVLLTAAAMLVPIFTKRNIYCTHICPHGAVQQLVRNRLPVRPKLSARVVWVLKKLPALLLAACFTIIVAKLPLSLVGFEPFDAWHFRIAGWATIGVAAVGLVASLFVPMAYCRYGCPTGAMLQWLRFSAQADRFGGGDWLVLLMAAIACAVWML